MDLSSRYFLSLLSSFIKDATPVKPDCIGEDREKNEYGCDNVDWRKIYQLASIHSLGGAVYLAVQKLENDDKPDAELLNKFKSEFFHATYRYEEQEKEYSKVVELLNREKIRHIFFKGVIVREYYPVKQVRTQGDIDFLIYPEDRKKVEKIFTDLGYRNFSTKWHDKYKKGKIVFEGHDNLINHEINSKVDYFAYFANAWEYAKPKDNTYTYELEMNYHLVFLITHIAKHFYDRGAGVRLILDIAAILNKYGEELDFQIIWKHLENIKLDLFAKHIFALCERWFGVNVPGLSFEMDESTYSAMSRYILEGGTFGYSNDNSAISALRKEYEKTESIEHIKIKALFRKIFLSSDIMREKYPILKKHPYLLVFAWIYRGIQCIVKKRKRTFRILKGIREFSEEGKNNYIMMKKIGL
ncbi:MAG TPA: nucleotidyltransferase family protein [Acetivibrio clariflavus]|nr:nucleotidyltransferase family protein [Acetivibrio clariflavus]